MGDGGASPARAAAGVISRIRLENFMCHSSLQIELADCVNFITGQNGSGKSAILTALCVAFGCRAKGTQRAATLKDFIKTGCSYAAISVEIKNQGEDAFKPELYGNLIILERRITESSSSMVLKDQQGKKVAQRRDDLRELTEHFNIDVENPCVIMTQDKSREFLHSGNDRDRFKFFFKATLLQQVSDLLENIRVQLSNADSIVEELEQTIQPVQRELDELQQKIKSMEHVEEIAHDLDMLKKKLAWSWVYDVDRQSEEQGVKLQKLKDRIPACEERIHRNAVIIEELKKELVIKKEHITSLMEKTSEVRRMKQELEHKLSVVTKERLELQEEHARGTNMINKLARRLKQLEQQLQDFQEQHMQETQAEVSQVEEQMRELHQEIDAARSSVVRLQEEENELSEELSGLMSSINAMAKEIEVNEKRNRDLVSQVADLRQRQTNKVTAFGGERVLNLLRSIERHHTKFKSPPIGPVGVHVKLLDGDYWSLAVDVAIGRLLDAFIVTCHGDLLVLRDCAKEANYRNVQIIIYDFARPRLDIPNDSLPSTIHPTILSVISSDNPTVLNVLVDQGSAERQVLVRDYEAGKSVAFEQRIHNLKDVYTSDGYRMFFRGSVQTTLPPNRRGRTGRLCGSLGDKITAIEGEAAEIKRIVKENRVHKRKLEDEREKLEAKIRSVKRRGGNEERHVMSKQLRLEDMRNVASAENSRDPAANVGEIEADIMQVQEDIHQKEMLVQKVLVRMTVAAEKENDLRTSYKSLLDSAKDEVESIDVVERELQLTEEKLLAAEQEKTHYEGVMEKKVLPEIKMAEEEYKDLQRNRQENFRKASMICSESEVEAFGGVARSTPEQLSAQINRKKQLLHQESRRYSESIDDLRAMYEKKERKISRKKQLYGGYRGKLNACQKALDMRWNKFQRNASLLKRQLTWQFNGHLRKKGISGHIKIDYEDKTLSVEVKMPQDASGNTVRDTRGLSGGERSFSTLCFALALHEMTEAPFRAMDEFDVFMDAVSRKISLDTLVEFAVAHGSQWIFITPHDISMVNPGDRIKKQQMAAPRG